ncbi:MAG: trypsin-like serine protease [Chloroflexota bacterium]
MKQLTKSVVKVSSIAAFLLMLLLLQASTTFGFNVSEDAIPDTDPPPPDKLSDSDWLRLSDEQMSIPNKPAPAVNGSSSGNLDIESIEVYDVAAGTSAVLEAGLIPESVGEPYKSTAENIGLLPSPTTESVIGTDDRARIFNTTTFPWRTITKLFVTFPNGAQYGCSGAIIDNYHVLTAGHCIHDSSLGGWASTVEVIPGFDDGYTPYSRAYSTYMRTYTEWTQNRDWNHDWALLTIDRNIGAYTGWMGRETGATSSSIYTGVINTAGYPGDSATIPNDPCPTNSQCMYFDADNPHSVTDLKYYYYMDTFGGQSGSAVWRYDSTNVERYIQAVHAYGFNSFSTIQANSGTRLNQDKYDRINTWISEDTPPTDLADLIDDGQAYSGFFPTTIQAGQTFQAYNDVRNVGTANAGTYKVYYYASTNNFISEFDFLIGVDTITSTGAFSWSDSSWSGNFPSSIPPGTYYVGWIIDADSQVSEFVENNNTEYKTTYQLTVEDVPTSSDLYYMSSTTSGVAGGVTFTDEDIMVWNGLTGQWARYFDGSDVGLSGDPNKDVDAFALLSDGSLLLSFAGATSIPNVGSVDDSDLIKFVPTKIGPKTEGTFQMYLDGSDVGLTTDAEDIDGVSVLSDGRIVISTLGAAQVTKQFGNQMTALDEDLIAFTPTSLGSSTAGYFSFYFDGSDIGLDQPVEDVWAVSIAGSDIYLSALDAFNLPSLAGDLSDTFACFSATTGTNSSCSSTSLEFDGNALGIPNERLDAVHVEQNAAVSSLTSDLFIDSAKLANNEALLESEWDNSRGEGAVDN